MSRRSLAAATALAVVALPASALAAKKAAPAKSTATVQVIGGAILKPGVSITDNMRYATPKLVIKSGGTLTIRNKTKAPHSFSIVRPGQVPKTAGKVDNCFEKGICLEIAKSHGSDGQSPPTKPLVDVGAAGFDQAGDSVFFPGKTQKVKITAKKGTTLSYICALHPWMQGTVTVK